MRVKKDGRNCKFSVLSDSCYSRVDIYGEESFENAIYDAVLCVVGSDACRDNVPPPVGKFEGQSQKVAIPRLSDEPSPIAMPLPLPLLDKATMGKIVSSIVLAIQPLVIQAVTAAVTSAMEAAVNA